MLDQALVGDVLRQARQGGADFAELYVERWRRRAMRVLSGEVKEATSGLEYGAGLRLFYGTEVVYAYTNDLSPASLLEVAETLVRLKGRAGQWTPRAKAASTSARRWPRGCTHPRYPLAPGISATASSASSRPRPGPG